jgi:general secretion pathway protein D
LTAVFQTSKAAAKKKGQAAIETDINMVADDRTNSLIISASEYDTGRVKSLIKILDQEVPRGMGNIRVHYLQYADAEELAKVLTALPQDTQKSDDKGKPVAPVISKEVKIMADKSTNSLVITTDKQDYLALSEVINKLDIPRSMVYIEALIMEVKATKEFEIGTEWRVGDDSIGEYDGRTYGGWAGSVPGTSILPSSTNLSLPAGVSMGILGEAITIGGATFASLGAIARAYQSDSDVHILQTPQILTTDNEEAEIQVTDNIPYLTKEATGDQEYQTYEYRDVGLKLKITPQINRDRFVRLKISQEYSTISTGGDRPTTLKRAAVTTVIVKDREAVVIGGLVGDQISRGTTGVPCLANIPVLGWAFKSYSRDQDKTNLFIFLTPYVVQAPDEAKKIYEQKKGSMDRIEEGVIKMYQRAQPPITPTDTIFEDGAVNEGMKDQPEIDAPEEIQEPEEPEETDAPREIEAPGQE